jgi:hypothetical protein
LLVDEGSGFKQVTGLPDLVVESCGSATFCIVGTLPSGREYELNGHRLVTMSQNPYKGAGLDCTPEGVCVDLIEKGTGTTTESDEPGDEVAVYRRP